MSATYKKCIVLDLDNTLWGGVIGEDGMDGIKLSMDEAGAGFIAFQQALLDMYHRGILLAINSNNNPDDALAVIRTHPNMILKEQHFAAMRMNWDDKALNIRSLAEELNIGLDAMVFFDDNPLHRESVRAFLPDVAVPDLPLDSGSYTEMLHALPYFPNEATTNEDAMRGNLYVTERLRREAEKRYTTKEEFLSDLGLKADIYCNDISSTERIAQLTDKTNQFNTHKSPLTPEEVSALMASPDYDVFSLRVTDRFGDYGIIGVAMVTKEPEAWHAEQLLMSCRILGRGAEFALVGTIAARAEASGVSTLTFAYTPTEKNIPAKIFLDTVAGDTLRTDLAISPILVPSWFTVTTHHIENYETI